MYHPSFYQTTSKHGRAWDIGLSHFKYISPFQEQAFQFSGPTMEAMPRTHTAKLYPGLYLSSCFHICFLRQGSSSCNCYHCYFVPCSCALTVLLPSNQWRTHEELGSLSSDLWRRTEYLVARPRRDPMSLIVLLGLVLPRPATSSCLNPSISSQRTLKQIARLATIN